MSATTTGSKYPTIAVARPTCFSARSPLPSLGVLRSWIAEAKPGERLTYHRGFLALDRAPASPSTARERARLDILAKHVLAAAEVGLIHLFQRRLEAGSFHYIAVKAHARTASPWHR
jgi:hypothetical protein